MQSVEKSASHGQEIKMKEALTGEAIEDQLVCCRVDPLFQLNPGHALGPVGRSVGSLAK